MIGGSWQLAVGGDGDWRLVAVRGSCRRLVVGNWWCVGVGNSWLALVAVGSWRLLAVGGPWGRS